MDMSDVTTVKTGSCAVNSVRRVKSRVLNSARIWHVHMFGST